MPHVIPIAVGGGTKLFAAIGVTYPAGSTLTCTNGTKTLKAKNTSGQWVFAIPEAGTWTVKAVSGSNSKSQSVSITKEGQWESVTLSYSLVLYNNGVSAVPFIGEKSPNNNYGSASFDVTNGAYLGISADSGYEGTSSAYISTEAAVDITNYSTLTFTLDKVERGGTVGLSAEPLTDVFSASLNVTAAGEAVLDVSAITGAYYINMYVKCRSAGTEPRNSASLQASKIELK